MKIVHERYEIHQSLGFGCSGEVYLAYDRDSNREVAIKRLLGWAEDEAFRRYRENEVRIHAQLASRYVVSLYDSFQWDKGFYLVFELMDHSLAKYREPVEYKKVVGWASDCLRGLQDIHAQGVIHRDIKPTNIFIDRNGSVRVGEFGAPPTNSTICMPPVQGKYIAPEILIGDQSKVGPPSDLYSLGLVIYQLILGEGGMKRAFPEVYKGAGMEDAITNRWLLWQMNADRVAPMLKKLMPGLPEGISDWLQGIVNKDSAKRYQSAAIALQELQRAIVVKGK